MPTEFHHAVVAASDDEIKAIIRQRRASGLPCSPVALRDAVGRGGTERLARLIREVRGESVLEDSAALSGAMPSGSETLPPELRKRIEAIEVAMVAAIGRARIEERATTATLLEDIREDGERRIHALAAIESAGADDAIALAETLDVMNERVEDLKATLATTEARANQAESRQAIAEARAEEAERSVARTNDTVHALRIERDALQVALTSLQKSLDPLIARRSLTPPSAPRRTRRAVRSDAKAP